MKVRLISAFLLLSMLFSLLPSDILAVEALNIMNNTGNGITQLFVIENNKPVGVIHIHDCLRAGVA